LHLFLAHGFAALKDFERALEHVERARRADPDNWEALGLEARIRFQARRYEQAVDRAVESLALIYFQPALHHVLGLALQRLGEKQKAESAYRTAVAQAPEFVAALDALGRLVSQSRARIGEGSLYMARAAQCRLRARERRQARRASAPTGEAGIGRPGGPPHLPAGLPQFDRSDVAPPEDRSQVVTVVAGLPRTGTSMMMQMLGAAGLPAYADEHRPADSDNPRGYFEHEQATRLHRDAAWIPRARGKAVKIVAHLLPYLPAGEQYRLIFMHRNIQEVVASQRAMLERLGRKGGELGDARLIRTYTQQLVQVQTWLRRRAEIPVLAVNYAEALADPAATAARLARFLGEPFDAQAATAAIEPALRRQGAGTPTELASTR
jgi:tetratricopeptide (TPR) repeat protein